MNKKSIKMIILSQILAGFLTNNLKASEALPADFSTFQQGLVSGAITEEHVRSFAGQMLQICKTDPESLEDMPVNAFLMLAASATTSDNLSIHDDITHYTLRLFNNMLSIFMSFKDLDFHGKRI
jgi:hypothetical protein